MLVVITSPRMSVPAAARQVSLVSPLGTPYLRLTRWYGSPWRVRKAGYEIANLDATVILERPRLKDRKTEIRRRLAAILSVDEQQVNIKGKSHEGVDAVGRGEAIEAHAVVLLVGV